MTYKIFQTTNKNINECIKKIEEIKNKPVKIEYETRFDGIHYAYRIFFGDNIASVLVNMNEEMLEYTLKSYYEMMK